MTRHLVRRRWIIAVGVGAALGALAVFFAYQHARLAREWTRVTTWSRVAGATSPSQDTQALLAAAEALRRCQSAVCDAVRGTTGNRVAPPAAPVAEQRLPVSVRASLKTVDAFYRTRSDLDVCNTASATMLEALGALRLQDGERLAGHADVATVLYLAQRMRRRGGVVQAVYGAKLAARVVAWVRSQRVARGSGAATGPGVASPAALPADHSVTERLIRDFTPEAEELFAAVAREALCDYRVLALEYGASRGGLVARGRSFVMRYQIVSALERLYPWRADPVRLAAELQQLEDATLTLPTVLHMTHGARAYARFLADYAK